MKCSLGSLARCVVLLFCFPRGRSGSSDARDGVGRAIDSVYAVFCAEEQEDEVVELGHVSQPSGSVASERPSEGRTAVPQVASSRGTSSGYAKLPTDEDGSGAEPHTAASDSDRCSLLHEGTQTREY
eukprot:gnl/TRDRNA2_/TRDRNA2_164263_c1_seq2.p1 gnl/TRDRNA2_/TRDRNA2_164263_c1~~gnl/TRDRNA2_/TRDRNA2_164263_c1_seq2.p1  ORF type:complete len:127 (+),score=7.55 gnl/TRDRNA2_/TRDRNA2_164263_c1_seq2:123-503(+)